MCPCCLVSANAFKVASVLSRSLTDVLMGLLYYPIFWACLSKESTCIIKVYGNCQAAKAEGKEHVCWQVTCHPQLYQVVDDRCLCVLDVLTITSVHKEEPHVSGNSIENWTPKKE